MIGMLQGKVWEIQVDKLVINIQGVGYLLAVPSGMLGKIRHGQELTLYTHLMLREEEFSLYGFPSLEEKKLFLELLSVSGIGPKGSLGVLSMLGAAELESAIAREDVNLLTKVPGIGKKTAQRIVLELKDKFKGLGKKDESVSSVQSGNSDALEALLALGFGLDEARRGLEGIVQQGEHLNPEEQIKRALKLLTSKRERF